MTVYKIEVTKAYWPHKFKANIYYRDDGWDESEPWVWREARYGRTIGRAMERAQRQVRWWQKQQRRQAERNRVLGTLFPDPDRP